MNKWYEVILLLCFSLFQLQAELTHLPVQSDQVMLEHLGIGRNYYVHYLKDFKGRKYLLKQKNNLFSDMERALQSVREVLGAYIAHAVGIACQNVWIIPAHIPFTGKSFDGKPATLHELVPGKMVRDIKKWQHLKIRQKGKLGIFQRGMQYHIISNMAQHPALPSIVALDTMVGNGGRHNKNFFYDQATDTFWVIDMGGSYTFNQVEQSCKNLQGIIDNSRIAFSSKQLQAVQSYARMLKKIETVCTPEILIQQLELFLQQGQFSPEVSMYVYDSIVGHIHQSYEQLPQLLDLIDQLLLQKRA